MAVVDIVVEGLSNSAEAPTAIMSIITTIITATDLAIADLFTKFSNLLRRDDEI